MFSGCLVLLLAVGCSGLNDYFWHITDFHYDPDYWTTQESCNHNLTAEEQGRYGDYACDAPWELVKSSVEALRRHGPSPTFIMWTGDNGPHAKNTDTMSTSRVIEILRNTTALIKDNFPNTHVYVTLGNHDYYPASQMPGEENEVFLAAAEMWEEWIDTPTAQSTFKKGAYYTRVMDSAENTKLRAVIVNTNLYYANNKATEGQTDPAGQYAWLDLTLSNAESNSEKVHVITHIPPGALELPGRAKWFRPDDNKRFTDLLIKYGDIIVGIYSSHQHFDTFRIFYDNNGRAVTSMLIAPSVTPWRARIGNEIVAKAHNPGVRKVTYDRYELHLVDVEQYWLDLPRANANQTVSATWNSLYRFRAAYGVNNITAPALQQLLDEFKQFASSKFHDYFIYNSVKLDPLHPSNSPCDCACKIDHLCAIEFIDFDDYTNCMETSSCDTSAASTREASWTARLLVAALLLSRGMVWL